MGSRATRNARKRNKKKKVEAIKTVKFNFHCSNGHDDVLMTSDSIKIV